MYIYIYIYIYVYIAALFVISWHKELLRLLWEILTSVIYTYGIGDVIPREMLAKYIKRQYVSHK